MKSRGVIIRVGDKMRFLFMAAGTLALLGCAEQSAMRLAQDTVQINVSTAPVYGALEPQRRAMRMAAEETVKSGYDKFIIVGGASGFSPNVIGHAPAVAQSSSQVSVVGTSTGSIVGSGSSQSRYVGPHPIAMPRFESAITVKMFKANDPVAANAVDARQVLAEAKAQ